MNRTNFEHLGFSLLITLVIFLISGNEWAAALCGPFFFLGREHAQYEKKLVHGGHVGGLNPFKGFQFVYKSLDGSMDFMFPVLGSVGFILVHHLLH
jgi:hypothetical protein